MRLAILSAMTLLLVASMSHAAEDAAGMVKTLSGAARIERGGAAVPIQVGSVLLVQDRIVTGSDGSVGVTLKDDTRLSVGPNSTLALDKFSFNPTTNEGALSLQILKGTLRSVTGLIARQSPTALVVRTPTATVGVRGTDFIVEVPDND